MNEINYDNEIDKIIEKAIGYLDSIEKLIIDPNQEKECIDEVLATFGTTKGRGVLYQIFIDENDKPSYIGKSTTSVSGIKVRLRQHLYGASFGTKTKSKYAKINEAFQQNKKVAVKYILISPKYLTSTIES
ncbi:hypothetical protein ACFLSU_02115 [Bacteroidota bacterium]